jgi:hypothetical protein
MSLRIPLWRDEKSESKKDVSLRFDMTPVFCLLGIGLDVINPLISLLQQIFDFNLLAYR